MTRFDNFLLGLVSFMLTILLFGSCPRHAHSADVYYPWPLKDPQPPVVTIDPPDAGTVEDPPPRCSPANEDCEEP